MGFGPGAMEVPGAGRRADHIVTPLHDDAGNVTNLLDILGQIVFGREETIVHEVVAFDARKGQRELRVGKFLDRFVIKEESRSTAFPNTPGAGGFNSHLLVIAGQTAIVSAHHIVPLAFGNDFQKFFPNIGKNPACALLIEPLDLFWTAEKDSAWHDFSGALGMLLGISERQGAAPRSAEPLPLLNAQMLAQ